MVGTGGGKVAKSTYSIMGSQKLKNRNQTCYLEIWRQIKKWLPESDNKWLLLEREQ